jgi:Uma2 family endonuclease
MFQTALALPHGAPFTVDDLFRMPDDGNRYEVLGGSLVVSPAPAPMHQLVADELRLILRTVSPPTVRSLTSIAVRMPNADGPAPDIAVVDASQLKVPGAVSCQHVHSVVEVVSPSNALVDRAFKRELYAEAGIPCYWRVELNGWRGYSGALPLVVVRLRHGDEWRTVEAAAGTRTDLPLAVGRGDGTEPQVVTVRLDPATLIEA